MVLPRRLAADAVAGAVLGGGICLALATVWQLPLLAAAGAGAAVLVGVCAGPRRVAGKHAMPAFVPAPIEFSAHAARDATGELREALARLRGAVG